MTAASLQTIFTCLRDSQRCPESILATLARAMGGNASQVRTGRGGGLSFSLSFGTGTSRDAARSNTAQSTTAQAQSLFRSASSRCDRDDAACYVDTLGPSPIIADKLYLIDILGRLGALERARTHARRFIAEHPSHSATPGLEQRYP